MRLDGIHHISAITGDAQRNVDFYTRVLGLRMIAKTVNQDDPSVYHLFYGDEHARPGAGRMPLIASPSRNCSSVSQPWTSTACSCRNGTAV